MASSFDFELKPEQEQAVQWQRHSSYPASGLWKECHLSNLRKLKESRKERLCCSSCYLATVEHYSRPVKQVRLSWINGSSFIFIIRRRSERMSL